MAALTYTLIGLGLVYACASLTMAYLCWRAPDARDVGLPDHEPR